jgi:hypothetical protein
MLELQRENAKLRKKLAQSLDATRPAVLSSQKTVDSTAASVTIDSREGATSADNGDDDQSGQVFLSPTLHTSTRESHDVFGINHYCAFKGSYYRIHSCAP